MTTATIATTGTGRREKSPDRAVVKIDASGEGTTAAEARDAARQTAASIRERVADSTFDVESLTTVKSILRD